MRSRGVSRARRTARSRLISGASAGCWSGRRLRVIEGVLVRTGHRLAADAEHLGFPLQDLAGQIADRHAARSRANLQARQEPAGAGPSRPPAVLADTAGRVTRGRALGVPGQRWTGRLACHRAACTDADGEALSSTGSRVRNGGDSRVPASERWQVTVSVRQYPQPVRVGWQHAPVQVRRFGC